MSVEDYLNDVHKDCSKACTKLGERGLAEGVRVTPFYILLNGCLCVFGTRVSRGRCRTAE